MRPASELDAKRRRTVMWVVSLATLGLMFDGYDLVVYGTVVSVFLRNPNELGMVTPEAAGALGSCALIGVLVGALLAGTVGDILGRRKVMLTAYAWFAVGMGITAMTSSTAMFGLMRFVTGLGVGALVATTAALVSEVLVSEVLAAGACTVLAAGACTALPESLAGSAASAGAAITETASSAAEMVFNMIRLLFQTGDLEVTGRMVRALRSCVRP